MQRIRREMHNAQQGNAVMREVWQCIKPVLLAGRSVRIEAKPDTRSDAQNRLMWSCLGDLSAQVKWAGHKLQPEGWKDFITGHIAGQLVLPNMDGDGFIVVGRGRSTSEMTITEMTEVIDRCHAFGDLHGVRWRRTSLGRDVPDEAAL